MKKEAFKYILKKIIKEEMESIQTDEATTSAAVPGVMTPFAFAPGGRGLKRRKQIATAASGYELVNNGNPVTEVDRDPLQDPGLDGKEQSMLPTTETKGKKPHKKEEPTVKKSDLDQTKNHRIDTGDAVVAHKKSIYASKSGRKKDAEFYQKVKQLVQKHLKKKVNEGYTGLKYEQEAPDAGAPSSPAAPKSTAAPASQEPAVQTTQPSTTGAVKSVNVFPELSGFEQKLNDSTEEFKQELQNKLNSQFQNKKVMLRGSKGYGQPEKDYIVNVIDTKIDYYYGNYKLIIVGREEQKQKVHEFFLNVGFKVKVLGEADALKPKDVAAIEKSKELSGQEPTTQKPSNTLTTDKPKPAPQPAEKPEQSGTAPAPTGAPK